MRSIPPSLLITLLMTCPLAQAEEPVPPAAPTAPATITTEALEQRLARSEQLRSEQEANSAAQLQRLRQENQRLRAQLRESQAQPRLLSVEQTWFSLGAALCLFSVLLGALLRGRRRTSREWIN
ncbi:translation initiation factor 2 (IF-2, GTPase) [Pseudomonas sp. NCCP-436]|uniref:translation initiation factor 2 (IF-2, GTPase) n=1 Tax=Pseudomonas sp. NCCP-436 TaxID=2842481 RepID=UPI001C816E02|nr:translation initiation factor 2 (IF-2, GTPase) [Pseudomonas sp. NCCP-436]GIZ13522.1 hypothetical protein NCCP436_29380 [Pseudomonas sp. NCCP-436]